MVWYRPTLPLGNENRSCGFGVWSVFLSDALVVRADLVVRELLVSRKDCCGSVGMAVFRRSATACRRKTRASEVIGEVGL
jgi:hypothetical protein